MNSTYKYYPIVCQAHTNYRPTCLTSSPTLNIAPCQYILLSVKRLFVLVIAAWWRGFKCSRDWWKDDEDGSESPWVKRKCVTSLWYGKNAVWGWRSNNKRHTRETTNAHRRKAILLHNHVPTFKRSSSCIPHLRTLKRAKNGALAALCIGVPEV